MRKAVSYLLPLALTAAVVTGCSGIGATRAEQPPHTVDIRVETQPHVPRVHREAKLIVRPTAGARAVSGAEVWVSIRGEREKRSDRSTAKPSRGGSYELTHVFHEPGRYQLTVQVEKDGVTSVAVKNVTVEGRNGHGTDETGHMKTGNDEVMIHIMKEEGIEPGRKTKLVAHLMKGSQPLTKAGVQFEYWTERHLPGPFGKTIKPKGARQARQESPLSVVYTSNNTLLGGDSCAIPSLFEEFWPFYVSQHSKPATRRWHFVGTGLVVFFLLLGLFINPWLILLAPVVAYGLAWYSHFFFEGNKPATFGHPIWSLQADFRMFGLMLTGRMEDELSKLDQNSVQRQ